MSREEIHKLVGGYATGTLTPEERAALFQAALDDQELFDALAGEEALRDLLSDPASKAQVLAALDERTPRWYQRIGWLRPAAAALAMAGMAAVGVVWWRQMGPANVSRSQAPLVAQVRPTPPPAAPVAQGQAGDQPVQSKPLVAPGRIAPGGAPVSREAASPVRRFESSPSPPPKPVVLAPAAAVAGNLGASAQPAQPAAPAQTQAVASAAPPPTPALAGTVTDPTGTVVPGATIAVALDNLAVQMRARTDAQGNWSIAVPQPGLYHLTVAAPGFKTEQAAIDSQAAEARQIHTRLDVGASSEVVEVTPGVMTPFRQTETAAQLQPAAPGVATVDGSQAAPRPGTAFGAAAGVAGAPPSGARRLYEEAVAQPESSVTRVATGSLRAPMARAQAGPVLGLSYSVLPAAAAGPANTVEIRFTPAADGYLTVTTATGTALETARVERLKPFLTRPLPLSDRQVAVTYSRQPPPAMSKTSAQDSIGRLAPPVPPLQQTVAGVTYVAAPASTGALTFTIQLK